MSKVKQTTTAAKTTAPPAPPKSAGFDAKAWAKNGVTEEEVTAAKTAFDLFDSDQGGSVDIKGIAFSKPRIEGRNDFSWIREQERSHLPDVG